MENMVKAEDELVAYIRAYFRGESIKMPIDSDVIELAYKHQVQNFIYMAMPESQLQNQDLLSIATLISQNYAIDELTNYFEEHGLYVMPIKGICTRKRYSDPTLRLMGDIDILCKPEQTKDVNAAMESLGYGNHVEGRKHDSYTMPPYLLVEVHRDMVDGDNVFYNYYKDVWNRCNPQRGYKYVYEMSLEDEYIFNLVHLAFHFKEGGIGLRFFVDVYVYESLDMDWQYVSGELEKLGLAEFYHNISGLALYWFGTSEERKEVEFTDVMGELEAFVWSGGLFGSVENIANAKAGVGRVISLIHSCFPGYASMKSMFPWLKPLLLPYAWLLRAIRAMRHRKGNIRNIWNYSMKGNVREGKRLVKFYKDCGLNT
jgi:hypothetical protein